MMRRPLFLCLMGLLLMMGLPVFAQSSAQVIPMSNGLRVRSAPNTDSTTLELLYTGDTVTIMDQTDDYVWYQVTVNTSGVQGWVASRFVELTSGSAVPVQPAANTASSAPPVEVAETNDAVIDESAVGDMQFNGVQVLTNVNANAIHIFRKGQELGNRPNVFSKVGDSITFTDYFLDNIGRGIYELDTYWYLEGVIGFFMGQTARDTNSFEQNSIAAQSGWNAYLLQNPEYANAALCFAGETPLECEYRHTRPSIALIMLGTNDVGFVPSNYFRVNMEWIVQTSIDNGVIPVLSTIPVREDYPQRSLEFNRIIRDIAARYQVPLWDYHGILATLPNGGIGPDGVHPTGSPAGWVGQADFKASNLVYGFPVRNLSALMVLHTLWQQVIMKA